jgi:hypothetical protein
VIAIVRAQSLDHLADSRFSEAAWLLDEARARLTA